MIVESNKAEITHKCPAFAKPLLGDRYFLCGGDLRILIRNENEKQKFKP